MSLPVPYSPPKRFSSSIRTYVVIGLVTCCALVFGFGGWAATAKLSSAVIAGGTVVVASNVKQVQHPDGGIVGEIKVKDGQEVEAGELLVRLDETLVAANRALLDGQIIAMEARLARLRAERDDADTLEMPEELAERADEPLVKAAIAAQRKVFNARKDTMEGQVNRLNERIDQLHEQIEGQTAQKVAKDEELALIEDELTILSDLYDRGRTTRDKVVNMKRNKSRLEGERGQLVSQIAVAKGRINETELEVLQLTNDRREKTFNEITEIEPELANLKERRAAAEFQLQRMDIRSPASGTVFELAVHTVGGVVQPGDTIMRIVPHTDQLVIEAQLQRQDIDQVDVGESTDVFLSAFDFKSTPKLHGKVTFVSAEASRDEQSGLMFYTVRVALDEGELERLPEDLVLLPGMPAELYIATGEQTVVGYLVNPLSEQLRRVWRES